MEQKPFILGSSAPVFHHITILAPMYPSQQGLPFLLFSPHFFSLTSVPHSQSLAFSPDSPRREGQDCAPHWKGKACPASERCRRRRRPPRPPPPPLRPPLRARSRTASATVGTGATARAASWGTPMGLRPRRRPPAAATMKHRAATWPWPLRPRLQRPRRLRRLHRRIRRRTNRLRRVQSPPLHGARPAAAPSRAAHTARRRPRAPSQPTADASRVVVTGLLIVRSTDAKRTAACSATTRPAAAISRVRRQGLQARLRCILWRRAETRHGHLRLCYLQRRRGSILRHP
jgi:hypothetical protein